MAVSELSRHVVSVEPFKQPTHLPEAESESFAGSVSLMDKELHQISRDSGFHPMASHFTIEFPKRTRSARAHARALAISVQISHSLESQSPTSKIQVRKQIEIQLRKREPIGKLDRVPNSAKHPSSDEPSSRKAASSSASGPCCCGPFWSCHACCHRGCFSEAWARWSPRGSARPPSGRARGWRTRDCTR